MSKFNNSDVRNRKGNGLINSEQVSTVSTHQGGAGYLRDTQSELFLAVVSDFGGEATFYESAANRTARINELARTVAVKEPEWFASLVKWLRESANLRSVSLIIALEGAKAMIDAGIPGGRGIVADAIRRADEPGEALAYWHTNYGKSVPAAIKRGIADAAVKTYSEYALGKYDTASHSIRWADVIRLTHPKPKNPEIPNQSDIFKFAMDRRVDSSAKAPESLKMLAKAKELKSLPKDELRALLKSNQGAQVLKEAGWTWENVAGEVGLDGEIWKNIIPNLGYMALLRNLRNFEKENVDSATLNKVATRLADPEQVAKSRQLPFRFLSAYRAVTGAQPSNDYMSYGYSWAKPKKVAPGSIRFAYPLEQALTASLANVPELKGNTLILVDRSGSMFGTLSKNTELNRADTAAVFGSALAVRAEKATLVQFGSRFAEVPFNKSSSLLTLVESFESMGGTDTALAVRKYYKKGVHDRVIILTDEQTSYYGTDPTSYVDSNVPVYTWNLAGYRAGHGAAGNNRYYFGGLTDQSFKLIPFIEAGVNAAWPWTD